MKKETLEELYHLVPVDVFADIMTMQVFLHTTKVKLKDMQKGSKSFSARVIKNYHKYLNYSLVPGDKVMELLLAVREYDQDDIPEGLGGHVHISLKERIEKILCED